MKKEKYTLKQIREWFRKLEENRYRKRYMVDAKRVHHYVNLGEDTDLPASLQRKNGTYTREKALAKQFKKFVREQARLAKEEQAKKITEIMETCVKLEVPSVVDAEFGPNWGEADQTFT